MSHSFNAGKQFHLREYQDALVLRQEQLEDAINDEVEYFKRLQDVPR